MYHDIITPAITMIAIIIDASHVNTIPIMIAALCRDNKIFTSIIIDASHVNIIPIMVDKTEKLWAGTSSTITTNQIRP